MEPLYWLGLLMTLAMPFAAAAVGNLVFKRGQEELSRGLYYFGALGLTSMVLLSPFAAWIAQAMADGQGVLFTHVLPFAAVVLGVFPWLTKSIWKGDFRSLKVWAILALLSAIAAGVLLFTVPFPS